MKIIANEKYQKKIKRAFSSLFIIDNKSHKLLIKNLRYIKVIKNDDENYNEIKFKEKTYYVNESILNSKENYLVSLFAHEAKHIEQYLRGFRNIDNRAERSAYLKQIKILRLLKEHKLVKWLSTYYNDKYCIKTKKKLI